MSEVSQNASSNEKIKITVSESVEHDKDIRARVRDVTLQALKTRHLGTGEVKEVVKAVTEGISLGLGKRSGEVKNTLAEAMAGLDEALTKSAQATHLALRELTSQGKEFTDHDLKLALDDLKILEEEFLATVSTVADSASDVIKREMKDLVSHVRRTGTDTGAKVTETLNEFSSRLKASVEGGAGAGKEAALEVSARLASVASGILSGLADALHEKSRKND